MLLRTAYNIEPQGKSQHTLFEATLLNGFSVRLCLLPACSANEIFPELKDLPTLPIHELALRLCFLYDAHDRHPEREDIPECVWSSQLSCLETFCIQEPLQERGMHDSHYERKDVPQCSHAL